MTISCSTGWNTAFAGSDEYVTFAVGEASVVGATLGTFDGTLLLNGLYEIRLTATDLTGQASSTSIHVNVDGNQKIGLFSLDFSRPASSGRTTSGDCFSNL